MDIKSLPAFDESITKIQYHTYNPYNTTFDYNDEIRISVQQQDLYILPHNSLIYIEGQVLRRNAENNDALSNVVNNFPAYLFDEIRYEINGFEVDKCKNVGITSTMKGYVSHNSYDIKKLNSAGWTTAMDSATAVSSFTCLIPLKTYLGFVEDYKKIVMNVKHELILIRSRTDTNCFFWRH